VDAKGATVEIADGVEGYIKVSDISKEQRIEDARQALNEGDEVEAQIVQIDKNPVLLHSLFAPKKLPSKVGL